LNDLTEQEVKAKINLENTTVYGLYFKFGYKTETIENEKYYEPTITPKVLTVKQFEEFWKILTEFWSSCDCDCDPPENMCSCPTW